MYNFPKFRDWLLEASLPPDFDILVNNTTFHIIRTKHLRDKRSGDFKPKDFAMSKNKYIRLFELIYNKISNNIAYSVTWTYNNKNNIISFEKDNDEILIFGAIMNSNIEYTKLYVKARNRIHLGELKL